MTRTKGKAGHTCPRENIWRETREEGKSIKKKKRKDTSDEEGALGLVAELPVEGLVLLRGVLDALTLRAREAPKEARDATLIRFFH